MNHKMKRIKQIVARTAYYGPLYPVEYFMHMCGSKGTFRSVQKKEESYVGLSGQKYADELKKWFHASTGERIDFDNPVTFSQKLQWLKIYDRNPIKTLLADKYLVREWVKDRIGEQYLVPLLGVWDRFDDIDFSLLPQKFALKCNHGSGWNLIVEDKEMLDLSKVKTKFDFWMSQNFAYKAGFELHYKDIVPRIVAEEYMENSGGDIYDYKCYCFDGKVHYIQFLMGRKTELLMAYFDRDWNKQGFRNNHPSCDGCYNKPDNLDELISLAETLGAGFPYVRVDFYRLNDGTIKFGEMTFTPASGTQDWDPPETDYMLGELLHLPERKDEL